jgi:hypothetical protein
VVHGKSKERKSSTVLKTLTDERRAAAETVRRLFYARKVRHERAATGTSTYAAI